MNQPHNTFGTSVGRKYIMALSGLGLVGFIIMHLLGNLTLLDLTGTAFNTYAKSLHDFGMLAIAGEIALAGLILLHIYMAIRLTASYRAARPIGYAKYQSKGGPTKSNIGSRNMIVTGIVLLLFMVIHVWQFRFGPSIEHGYMVEIDGTPARDLFRVVVETFSNPVWVIYYVATMVFLTLHLRHGFWSMFQSLGAMYPKWSKPVYAFALAFAVLWSLGFVALPVYLFIFAGG